MRRIIIRFNAPVILSFALLSLLVLILDTWLGGIVISKCFSVYRAPMSDPLTYLRFFSHVLGHDTYEHYTSNMLLMLLVGPSVEERFGSSRTLVFIGMTAFVTGLIPFLFSPGTVLLGSSGVLFMLIVLSSFTELKREGIPMTLILVVIFYLGREFFDWLFIRDNISQLTHIVGGVCGIFFGFSSRTRAVAAGGGGQWPNKV